MSEAKPDMSKAAQQKRVDDWLALKIDLACYSCNAEGRFRTLEQATELGWIEIVDANYQPPIETDDGELLNAEDDLLNWYSHIGYCPNCTEEVVEPAQRELF